MMYIDEIYKFVLDILKKDQKGYVAPDEFNRAFNVASNGLFIQRYGLPEDYQPGRAVPKIAYAITSKLEDDTLPFKVVLPMQINGEGKGEKPKDYSHYIAIRKNIQVSKKHCGDESWKNYELHDIDVVPEAELAYRRSSKIVGATHKWPICTFYKDYILFYPRNIVNCEFVYLRMPVVAKWAFTEANGRPVFDEGNSIDTDWPVDTHVNLISRIIKLLAISLRENDIVGIMQQMKMEGE